MADAGGSHHVTAVKVSVRNDGCLDHLASRYLVVRAREVWPELVMRSEEGWPLGYLRRRFPLNWAAYNAPRALVVAECFGWLQTPCFAISVTPSHVLMQFSHLADDQLHHLVGSPLWDLTVSRKETIPSFTLPAAEGLHAFLQRSGEPSSPTAPTSEPSPSESSASSAPFKKLPGSMVGTIEIPGPIVP